MTSNAQLVRLCDDFTEFFSLYTAALKSRIRVFSLGVDCPTVGVSFPTYHDADAYAYGRKVYKPNPEDQTRVRDLLGEPSEDTDTDSDRWWYSIENLVRISSAHPWFLTVSGLQRFGFKWGHTLTSKLVDGVPVLSWDTSQFEMPHLRISRSRILCDTESGWSGWNFARVSDLYGEITPEVIYAS